MELSKLNQKRFVRSLLLMICVLIFHACNNSRGFSLQQFEVKNTQLDSIIHSFVDSIGKMNDLSNHIPIMELHWLNSFPAIYFINTEKESISPSYIFDDNRRIVGFIKTESKDVIVLTTINSKYKFTIAFYEFLIPTCHTKRFDFIYFPDDMYCAPDKNGVPYPPASFSTSYKLFIYRNDHFEIYPNQLEDKARQELEERKQKIREEISNLRRP